MMMLMMINPYSDDVDDDGDNDDDEGENDSHAADLMMFCGTRK